MSRRPALVGPLPLLVALVGGGLAMRTAHADGPGGPTLAALAPADDARTALAVGPRGQVYTPDGKGAWVRTQPVTTADPIAVTGRAGGAVVALGDGAVYRLAPNGWSAIRLAQKGKAQLASGPRAIAVVGRQVFALDRAANGEPVKLALLPTPALALASGPTGATIATERGLFRLDGGKLSQLKSAPRRVDRLVSERWALDDRAAVDLKTGTRIRLPQGLAIAVAAAGPGDTLVAVGASGATLQLVTVKAGKAEVEVLPTTIRPGPAVGVVVDKAGRATIALRDGRVLSRDRGTWSATEIRDNLPGPRPGSPPATGR